MNDTLSNVQKLVQFWRKLKKSNIEIASFMSNPPLPTDGKRISFEAYGIYMKYTAS